MPLDSSRSESNLERVLASSLSFDLEFARAFCFHPFGTAPALNKPGATRIGSAHQAIVTGGDLAWVCFVGSQYFVTEMASHIERLIVWDRVELAPLGDVENFSLLSFRVAAVGPDE